MQIEKASLRVLLRDELRPALVEAATPQHPLRQVETLTCHDTLRKSAGRGNSLGRAAAKVRLEAKGLAHVAIVRPDVGVLLGRLDQVHSLQVRMLRDTNHRFS